MSAATARELASSLAAAASEALSADDRGRTRLWPGPVTWRQPVHTVYVPADRFHARLAREWGDEGLATWRAHCGGASGVADLLRAAGFDGATEIEGRDIADRVEAKLAQEPIEDLRIDFEDGFTQRGVAPEDRWDHEDATLAAVLGALAADGRPAPFWGIRFGSFDPATRDRGIHTLTRFLLGLHEAGLTVAARELRLTFPKVTSEEQVRELVHVLGAIEATAAPRGVPADRIRHGFEIQVETPQSILAADGTSPLPAMITAGDGRVLSLHYGTYDYSAFLGVAAADQAMDHPVADHAKDVMQAAVAGRGVEMSDGSTNRLPLGDADAIREAWALHARLVGRHLTRGIWQGWDLHANQLPTRFAATYAWFRRRTPDALERLDRYLAGRDGAVADEPATAKAMAGFLGRAVDCGAVTAEELDAATGLDRAQLTELTRNGALP